MLERVPETLTLLRRLFEQKTVIGFDLVELSPVRERVAELPLRERLWADLNLDDGSAANDRTQRHIVVAGSC